MKTLDQIEPRIAINATNTPGDATSLFKIIQPGSYYLTGNVAVTINSAILINADHVTLDLNGFTISSTASPASGTAVLLNSTRKNITIKNGHIRGTTTYSAPTFTTGGFLDGVANATSLSDNIHIADLNIHGMGSDGINLASFSGPTFVVERCIVMVCASNGIVADIVRDCNVDTAGQSGIFADVAINCIGKSVRTTVGSAGVVGGAIVENCKGSADASAGISGNQVSNSVGISTSGIGLEATNASNCTGTSTSGIGLDATNASNCTGTSTSGIGLEASNASNCTGTTATTGASVFGLRAFGTASFCRGTNTGVAGVAISAPIAIGCTAAAGTITSAQKHLGTP